MQSQVITSSLYKALFSTGLYDKSPALFQFYLEIRPENWDNPDMTQPQRLTLPDSVLEDLDGLIARYPALAEAAAYGIDISLLIDNLRRPVEERIRRHQQALNAIQQLRKAKSIAPKQTPWPGCCGFGFSVQSSNPSGRY